jgi:hypothetical protein
MKETNFGVGFQEKATTEAECLEKLKAERATYQALLRKVE